MLESFKKVERTIESAISIVSFVVMVAMTSINVFSRYLLGKSFPFAEEIAYLMFAWCVFIGACNAYRTKGMVAVDILVDRLPTSVQSIVSITVDLLLLATNVVLAYLSIKISISGWARRTPSLAIPYTFMYLPAAIAFVVMAVSTVGFLAKDVKSRSKVGVTL